MYKELREKKKLCGKSEVVADSGSVTARRKQVYTKIVESMQGKSNLRLQFYDG